MKVFDTNAEYFLGTVDAKDMDIEEAQRRAATFDEDQDEDPEASEADIAHVYAITGMDPSMWDDDGEDTSPVVVKGGEPDPDKGIASGDITTPEGDGGIPPMLSRKAIEAAHVKRVTEREQEAADSLADMVLRSIDRITGKLKSQSMPSEGTPAEKAEKLIAACVDQDEELKDLVQTIAPHLAASFVVGAGAELELTKQAAMRKKAREVALKKDGDKVE